MLALGRRNESRRLRSHSREACGAEDGQSPSPCIHARDRPDPRRWTCVSFLRQPSVLQPGHLWLGDHQANMRDMFEKQRRTAAVGEANGKSRLTAAQVREFRRNYKGRRGELKAAIEHYGVHKNTLTAIVQGRTWRHVT